VKATSGRRVGPGSSSPVAPHSSSRNNLANIGRSSILPICPRAHAADLATPWFRSSKRSIITEMSSGRRRAQPQTLARIPGSGCRSRDRNTSAGRVEPIPAAVLTARFSAGPCTTPRTINRDTACAASRPPITPSARSAAACSPHHTSMPKPEKRPHSVSRLEMAVATVVAAHRPQSPTLCCQQGLPLGA
jgi:hypothetical protein